MNKKKFIATAPSNIAFIKYWGKKDAAQQIPANDSISINLSKSFTTTSAQINEATKTHEIYLAGKKLEKTSEFAGKILKHLDFLATKARDPLPLRIETENSFPDSCGIASSASGLAAVTLASLAAWTNSSSLDQLQASGFGPERLASLSRMGSGSSARSFFSGFVHWQAGDTSESQSFKQTTPPWELCDIIVLVSTAKKSVSSSKAHAYAWESPLFLPRLAGLPGRIKNFYAALSEKDFSRFGEIIEADCLEMHSIMQTGKPAVNYLLNETTEFITWLRKARSQGEVNAYFTIDAGPNVHVICEKKDLSAVTAAIGKRFSQYEQLVDQTGGQISLTVN